MQKDLISWEKMDDLLWTLKMSLKLWNFNIIFQNINNN